MEREDSKDKPADKDDTKDSKKQQQKPVSRGGGEEGGITTWSTYGGDHQDGSEEQDTASASSKKADGKRHRPGWVKKIALKPKKVPSLTDSTSSLTRDVRHDPMHAVAESGLDSEPGEWEGSCEPKRKPEDQSQVSIAELVENRERAIQDTEANEREKQQDIDRIRKADENIIEAAAKYKKQVTDLQSQLDAERLKNEQLAKAKQEADDALIRVCSVAPGGVEKSVKERHDLLRSENEKLADRAHTAEATVVQLTQGMKDLTERSKACEEQLKTQHRSDLESEKRQKSAMLKSKVESHNAGLARKEAELQALKEKLKNEAAKTIAVRKMMDAEILELQSQADAKKEVKAIEYSCLQKQIDAAMKQVAQNAHSAKQLEDLKKQWHDQEVRYEKDLQSIKDANEAVLKEKDAQMAEAKEQWGAEFQDLKKQLESMSAEVEKYKQVSVEQKAAIELSKGDGGPASNYQDSSTDEVAGEDSNKTDMQKVEHLQQQVDHLQKQLDSTMAELAESQRSLKQAEDHVVKLTADLTAKTNEADELAALVITEKPGEALAGQDELEKLRKLLQEKEAEIATLKTSLEHPTADQQRKASTGSLAQELDGETEKVSRLEGLLRSEKSIRKKAEGKIEALEEHLRMFLSKTQPEQMNVQLLASQMQPPASDGLSEEISEREQQLEEEIESMKAAEADLLGTVRQLQAEVKAKNNLLQLTQSAQAGSEEDAFKKVKQEYVLKLMESIRLKEQLKQCESQHQPGALEVPMCVRSLRHEEASSSGLSSSAQIEQLKIAIHMEKQKTGNLEATVRSFESIAREHKRLKEHQTVQSQRILELVNELAEAKAAIAHLEEEQHALQGEMGAARDTVATTKTEVAQSKHSVQVQLEEVTTKAEQLQAELNVTKSKCYELERKNEEMGKLHLKVQLGDVSAKSDQLEAELAEWKARCAKLEDDRTQLSEELKQAEARVKDVLETIDQEYAGRVQSEEEKSKNAQMRLHSSNRELLHANSVLKNDHRRLAQKLAEVTKERDDLQGSRELLHANSILKNDHRRLTEVLAEVTKERDDLQGSSERLSKLLKNAEGECRKLKQSYEATARNLSGSIVELEELRKRNKELQDALDLKEVETATYREDFEAERQEREEKANVVDSLKANLSLQHQYLDEYQEKLQANVQVSERLYEDIQVLELKRKEEAEQSEARLKEKEGTHEEEMNLSKAKEISFKDEIQNLTTKNEQLQNQCQQKLKEIERLITKHQQLQSQSQQKSEELNGFIAQLENELAGARADITGLEEELAGKTQQVMHYFKQVEDLRRQDERQTREATNQRFQLQSQWNEIDSLRRRNDSLQVQLQSRPLRHSRERNQRPEERHQEELARYRIMSYQPLSGDTFSGAGSYGSVHRVRVNNIPCIAKRILDILVGREREQAVNYEDKQAIQLRFQQECVLLSRMRHPNIVLFIGVCYPDQNPLDLTLIMEFLPMDLEKCLQKYPNLPLPIKLSILLDVSYGLLHLHNSSIIHRDLTAANILLTHDMRAKVADLGVSKILEVHPLRMSKQSALPGALGYMPPEALWQTPQYGAHLDIFSFGVVALFVAVQKFPQFYELSRHETVDVQIKKRLEWIQMLPGKGCNCLHDLICHCLQDEAGHRPTTERLNVTLKQLSQDHPRHCTDIVHLEEELAQQKQEVASLVKEKENLKKQLIDAEVQKIPPVARYDTVPTPTANPQYSEGYQQAPSMSYGASQYPSKRALSKSTSVPVSQGFHQYQRQYPPQQQGYQLPYQAGSTEGYHRPAAIREEYDSSPPAELPLDPNLVCPMCGLQFRIGEIQKYKRHVQKCKG